jgi:ABC-type thiamine transport system substrate-binding protein
MAIKRFQSTLSRFSANPADWQDPATGGTLSMGYIALVYDDTVFTNTPEGKERLMVAVETLLNKIKTMKASL